MSMLLIGPLAVYHHVYVGLSATAAQGRLARAARHCENNMGFSDASIRIYSREASFDCKRGDAEKRSQTVRSKFDVRGTA
jgi:hypothetical protein